jgi:hypothetical protein
MPVPYIGRKVPKFLLRFVSGNKLFFRGKGICLYDGDPSCRLCGLETENSAVPRLLLRVFVWSAL